MNPNPKTSVPPPRDNTSVSPPRGKLFVIAAPSGAGKTSLVKALLERKPQLHVSISNTTRQKRPTEEAGREYYFVSVPQFEELVRDGQFLEHARVFDNLYGTARQPVEAQLAKAQSVVLEIDWQGAQQVRRTLPECTTVFILPPSRQALEDRLRKRRTDSDEVIERRLRDAVGDMSHWKEFDYVVVNDDFERAVNDLVRIVEDRGEDLAAARAELQPLLAGLLA
jgi:guanylate kinase